MKSKKLGFLIILALILATTGLFAQEPAQPKKDDDKKFDIGLEGKIYMEYAHLTGYQYTGTGSVPRLTKNQSYDISGTTVTPHTVSDKLNDTFRMKRVYLTWKKDIGDIFSVNITTDINPTGWDYVFLKFAYVQAKKSLGPVELSAQFGKIGTPVIGFTDQMSDYRWINENYINASKNVLNGNSFDNSADFGGNLSINAMKMVTVTYAFTNGEGFKADNSETYDGKSHTLLFSISPIQQLYLNLYGRWENTEKKQVVDIGLSTMDAYRGIESRNYTGAGIAWKSDLIKIGVNYFLPIKHYQSTIVIDNALATGSTAKPSYVKKFQLLDSWLHMNIGAVAPSAPVIIIGRFVYGKELPSVVANYAKETTTTLFAGGLGWQFNKNFRILAYYEHTAYDIVQKKNFQAFSTTTGVLSQTTYVSYIQKHDPRAARNFYVKAEVKY